MAKDGGSTILIFGAVAAAAYIAYKNGLFASLGIAPAAATTTATTASPATTTAVTTLPATTTAAAPASAPPAYSGPSLAQIFSQLSAAEQRDYGSNPALSCGASGNLSGVGIVMRASVPRAISRGISSAAAAPASCADPIASYDVHNWYLVNRTNGNVPDGLLQGGGQSGPLSQYWAWAAPQLQQHFPGLSGFGHVYAGLGALVRWERGW